MNYQKWLGTAVFTFLLAAGAQTAMAACVNNTCNTVQDQALTLTQADVGAPPAYDYANFSQGTVGSSVQLNGASLVTPNPICALNGGNVTPAQFDAGSVKWVPGQGISQSNQQGDPAVTVTFCAAGAQVGSNTLKLIVSDVNDPPQIQGNLLVNGDFAAGIPGSANEFPGWTITTINPANTDPALQYAYGGMAFNSGDKTPNGIASQTFATTAGATYTGSLRTTYGGYLTAAQSIQVQFIDAATQAVLYSASYGQQTVGAFSFTATGASTLVKITDTSTTTVSTDIALSSITVNAPLLAQTTLEDTPLLMSKTQSISVADPDVPPTTPDSMTLTLTVAHGTLSVTPLPSVQNWDHSLDGVIATASGVGTNTITITGNPAGMNYLLKSLTYTPASNFNGQDALALSMDDNGNTGAGPQGQAAPFPLTTSASIPITVIPVNDPPTGQDNAVTLRENSFHTFAPGEFSAGFADIDGNAFAGIVISSLPTQGTLTLSGAPVTQGQTIPAASIAQLVWTAPANQSGTALASFQFKVYDDGGTANGGNPVAVNANVMTLNVTPDTPPVAKADTYQTLKNTAVGLTPLANDTDADGDLLTITSINGTPLTPGTAQSITVPNGVVNVDASGVLQFVPTTGYVGSSSFSYAISDGYGGTASSTISIQVSAPAPVPGAATPVPLGGPVAMTLMGLLLAAAGGLRMRRRK